MPVLTSCICISGAGRLTDSWWPSAHATLPAQHSRRCQKHMLHSAPARGMSNVSCVLQATPFSIVALCTLQDHFSFSSQDSVPSSKQESDPELIAVHKTQYKHDQSCTPGEETENLTMQTSRCAHPLCHCSSKIQPSRINCVGFETKQDD